MSTVIVGAGVGGLAAAYELRKQGEPVTVLEAGPRAGGVMHADRRDGFLLETGPNSFLDKDEEFRALLAELGLTDQIVRARPEAKARYIVFRGRLEPLPSKPPELFKTPLLSRAGKLRALAEPLLARRSQSYDETLEEFGVRHLGPEATSRLLDAMQTGIYAGRIDELSAPATFPQLVELEREGRSLLLGMLKARKSGAPQPRAELCSFRDGMGQLADALAAKLGDSVKVRTPVTGIARQAGRWTVRAGGGSFEADQVVFATHPRTTAGLVRTTDAVLAEALTAIPHAPMVVVHLGVPRERVNHALDGFGFLCPAVENRRVLGCIFSSALFEGRAPEGMALLTVLLGGRRHPELVDLDDRAITLLVRDELRSLLGVDGEPELVNVVRHPLGIPQYVVGHRARMETIEQRLSTLPGMHLAGWGYRGVAVMEVIRSARALAGRLTVARGAA